MRYIICIFSLITIFIGSIPPETTYADTLNADTQILLRSRNIALVSDSRETMDSMEGIFTAIKLSEKIRDPHRRLIIVAAPDTIVNRKINRKYLSFLDKSGEFGLENDDTHNERCYVKPIFFPDGMQFYIGIVNTMNPLDENDNKCILLSFAQFLGIDASDFAVMSHHEMLDEIFKRAELPAK